MANPRDRRISTIEIAACTALVMATQWYEHFGHHQTKAITLVSAVGQPFAFIGILYLLFMMMLNFAGLSKAGTVRAALMAATIGFFFFLGPLIRYQRDLDLWYVAVIWAFVMPLLAMRCGVPWRHAIPAVVLTTMAFVLIMMAFILGAAWQAFPG